MEMESSAEEHATAEQTPATLWMMVVHEGSHWSCRTPVTLVPLYARSQEELQRLAQAWLEQHPGYQMEEMRAYAGGFAVTGRTWLEGTTRREKRMLNSPTQHSR